MLGVAVFGVAETFDAPAAAQVADGATTPVVPEVRVTVDPAQPSLRALSASDDGRIVALDTADDDTSTLVAVDRVAGAEIADVPSTGAHPGVSGDGCVVAYSELDSSGANVALGAVDLCATPVEDLNVGSVAFSDPLPAPAVSQDGDVIVWSTGDDLLRFTRSATGTYERDTTFAPVKGENRFFGPRLDIAGFGTILVYETLADPAEADPTLTTVHLWQPAETSGGPPTSTEIAGPGARKPTMDATGEVIAYEQWTEDNSWAIVIHDGTGPAETLPNQVLDDAWNPQLSADGHHLVSQHADGVQVTWWSDGDPFGSVTTARVMDTTSAGDDVPTNSGPSATVSATGRVILAVGDQSVAATDPPLGTGWYLWQHVRAEAVTAQSPVDLGSVTVGETATGTVRFINASQIGIPLARTDERGSTERTDPVGDARVTVSAWSCDSVAVWQPGTACDASVTMSPTTVGAASGTVRLVIAPDDATGADEIVTAATVNVVGVAPSTTVPLNTGPSGTVPTRPPASPLPSFPSFPGSGSGSGGSGSSGGAGTGTGSSTTTTTTTTTLPALPVFEPPTIEFAPTIVDAGRRTAEIAVFNSSSSPITVTSVVIDTIANGATDFAAGSADCVGASLAAQGRCTIVVTFAPATIGELQATLTAAFDDGRQATAIITGTGADSPVLTVEPSVATAGQVVSVRGAGFPEGAPVELSWHNGLVTFQQSVSEIGDFSETLVVLPHTTRGPTELRVEGQDGLFDDVSAELLIDVTTQRAEAAVFGRFSR